MTDSPSAEATLISVGLDLGSQNARVCFSNLELSSEDVKPPSIVPNNIGQRYTLALSTPEPEMESDPMNDQYWDDGKNNKKNGGSKPPKVVHYLYGDAARRSLQRLKKPLDPHSILTMLHQVDDNHMNGDNEVDAKAACTSFFQHLTNLTTNATHTSPQSLRFVVSVPVPSSCPSSTKYITNLSSSLKMGALQSIDEVGGYNKKLKKEIHDQKRVVAALTHPIAIAHAHKLIQPISSPSDPTDEPNQNVLIVDWGASALSISNLSINGAARITKHTSIKSLGGNKIISLLVKHIAELFERKVRGAIPPGETLCNKKAKAKLEVAAEDALRSFGYSPKVTITIDGLIDGIDCNVDVMLARFEMLIGASMREAEGKLKECTDTCKFDKVIGAGSIMRMKCVERMMDRLFPRGQVCRGENANNVPPEEAVAMGCAIYGSTYLSSEFVDESNGESDDMLVEEEVPLCPIAIGLCLQEGDPAAVVMIDRMSPLPALVTKAVAIPESASNSIGIVQINEDNVEKAVGRIEGLNTSSSREVEVTMELTTEGKLSISINGGEVFEF